MGSEWSCSWNYNYNEPTLHFKLSKWSSSLKLPSSLTFYSVNTSKARVLVASKLIKCFWIESFLHQISNWRYFGLGVIWEWNRLQISPSATCSLTFSLRPDSVWPAWKWDVIFVNAASSFLFLFLLPLPLPASCFLFLLLTPSLPLQTCCWHLWTFIWRWAFGSAGLWSGGSRDVWLQRWALRFLPPDELGPDSQSHKLL